MIRNDILWKGLIEDLFSWFIPFFLPQYQHLFDATQPPEFLDKELSQLFPQPEEDSEVKFVDKLVKVFTTAGEEKWVLIHIEVQGYQDANFAARMHAYYYRILDRYGVPVTAISIYTDNNASFCPTTYVQDFAGTQMRYAFNTYKVLWQDEALLKQSDNPFAIAILTVLLALKSKKLDDNNLLNLKVNLIRQLLSHQFSAQTVRQLFEFIRLYVNFAKPETRIKFEKEIDSFTKNEYNMTTHEIALNIVKKEGIKEGKEEGRKETFQEQKEFFVKSLLSSTDFSDEKIALLSGVDTAFVQQIKQRLDQ